MGVCFRGWYASKSAVVQLSPPCFVYGNFNEEVNRVNKEEGQTWPLICTRDVSMPETV